MSNPNLPPSPDRPRLKGREAAIAAMGGIAFRLEQGPNARPPEKITVTPETAPETGVEPGLGRKLTDDEASYVAGTLGPAVSYATVEHPTK